MASKVCAYRATKIVHDRPAFELLGPDVVRNGPSDCDPDAFGEVMVYPGLVAVGALGRQVLGHSADTARKSSSTTGLTCAA